MGEAGMGKWVEEHPNRSKGEGGEDMGRELWKWEGIFQEIRFKFLPHH